MKIKKILSVVLALLMITGMFSVGASASYIDSDTLGESDVYVGPDIITAGYYLIDENGNITAEGADETNYNVRFVPATETSDAVLTLNNAALSEIVAFDGEGNHANVLSGGNLVVELIGENHSYSMFGFASRGSITFTGSGKLSFNSSTFENDSYIVYSASEIIVEDSVKIVSQYNVSCGFYTASSVTIKDNAEVSFPNISAGVVCNGLTVSDNAKLSIHMDRFGVESYNSVTVKDNAVVNISAFSTDISGDSAFGLNLGGDLTVSGKAVLNVSSPDGKKAYGITAEGNIIASGDAKINASSGDSISRTIALYQRPGIDDYSALIIKDNAQVIANSGEIKRGADYYPEGNSGSNNAVAAENIEISGNGKLLASCGAVKNIEDGNVADSVLAIFISEDLTVYDNGYISAVTQPNESAVAAIYGKNISLYNKAVIDAETKGCLDGAYGIVSESLATYNEAKINVKSGGSISHNSFALRIELLNANDDSVITATASDGVSSAGIYSSQATFEENAIVTAESCSGNESCGIFATKIIAGENTVINAVAGDGQEGSYGIHTGEAEFSGATQITAVAGEAKGYSAGFFTGNLTMISDAVLNATGGKSGMFSIGAYSEGYLNITENSQLNAKAGLSDSEYSFGIAAPVITFEDSATVESSGETSAIYTVDDLTLNYDSSCIIVSEDTNPENAVEWDGENSLAAYPKDDEIIESLYKYVSVSPASVIHKVAYYLDADGEVYDTKTFAEGETIVHPIPETEPGITFVEWADENGNPLPAVMGTEDIVAYAVLNVESYNVTYMIDGSVYEKYTVTYGAEVSVPDVPEKEGFIFMGWTPDIPETMPANDLTFIAVFERKSYTLTYDVNGGSGNIAQQTGDVNYTIGSTVPFRSGYNFLGWSKNNSATSADYVPGDSIILTEDTVLYAVWAKRSYLLTESDIFSFVNSRSNFKTGTYTMTDSDFIKLTDYISKLYNAKTAATYINRLQVARSDAWGGSCFGMSMSVILNKTGQIDFVENFDPSAANMYGVARPYQNEAVQSAINYYQISQRVNGFRTTTYTIDKGNFSTGLEKLVNTVKDGNMTLLIYSWPEGCHAIVIVGYEKAEDGGHNLIAYDNRYGSKYINVYVDEGYNTCIVNGKEEAYYVEFNTNFSIFNKIDIDGPGNDMVFTSSSESIGTEIGIKLNGNITIKNAEGETLTVNNGIIDGDMEVLSSYVIVNSTVDNPVVPGTLMLKVEDSDSFTFDSTADEISASLSTDECYAEVTATADEVVISEDEGIYTTGDDIEFNGWLSLNNDMGDVINFDGQGDGEVNFLYGNNDEIIVEGANDESTITVYSNLVDVDEVTFSSEYETLNISGETDNIAITASSKNDGVFDVKVAEIINTEPAIEITNPSTTQINYGDKIILHANTETDLPKGYYIVWTANNDNFTCEVSGDGKTCTITPSSSGNTIITVTIYDENGEIIDTDTQEMTSKAGLWQKIVAFFKNIFGLTKTIPQFFKK